jgi:hypothetical protein
MRYSVPIILAVNMIDKGCIQIRTRPSLKGIRHAGTSIEIMGEELMSFDSEKRMPIPLSRVWFLLP